MVLSINGGHIHADAILTKENGKRYGVQESKI